jgi:aspartokinase/homoserine dehydrogenase 1
MAKQAKAPEIYKFGGASLGDGAAFKHAASIVKRCPGPLVAVCSAPAGVTDLLLEVADRARAGETEKVAVLVATLREKYAAILRELALPARLEKDLAEHVEAAMRELETLAGGLAVLRELTARTSDLVVARGERVGTRLFVAALGAAGVKAEYVDALEVVVTRGPFGGAAPDLEATDARARKRLRPLLAQGILPVVPGFLGVYQPRPEDPPALTTLGRGGTDLTATLMGRALGASRVTLWKDVPGLLTADPRLVPDARIIPQLNVREAAELAYYGAKVLHPRALIPLADQEIPLFVRPFGDPVQPGTEISARHTLDEYPVKALSAITAQALVTVAGRGLIGVPGVAGRTFATLSDARMSVSLITQSSSEQSICFTVPEKEARAAKEALERAFAPEIARREVDSVQVEPGMSTVAVVGLGMAGTPGIAARVFSALSAANINLVAIAQGSSELNISFVVKSSEAAVAQKAIHQAFQLSKIGGGRVTHTQTVDVVLLGYGQIGRTLAGLLGKRKEKNGSSVRVVGVVDRSGFVFDHRGLPGRKLNELAGWKEQGKTFATCPGGQVGTPVEAVGFFARHALARPVLVDVTADETGPVLLAGLKAGLDLVMAKQAPAVGPQVRARRAAVHRRGARPPAAVRGHGGRWSAGAGHPPQAGRIWRQGAEDRGLRLGHARLPVHRTRPGAEVLRSRAGGDGQGLHRTRPARRSVGRGRRAQGADPRPLAGLRRRAGRRGDREPGAGGGAGADQGRVHPAAARLGRGVGEADGGGQGQGSGAALRGQRDPQQDQGGVAERRQRQPVCRPEGDGQPDCLHHQPLPQPAGDPWGRGGVAGDRGRRIERHPGPGGIGLTPRPSHRARGRSRADRFGGGSPAGAHPAFGDSPGGGA